MQRTRRWKSAVVALSVLGAAASLTGPAKAELGDPGPNPFGFRSEVLFALDGPTVGSPALSSWSWNRLDTWVIGGDGAVWHHVATPDSSGWEHLGGASRFGPAAVSWGFERADVFVTGLDGALWQRTFDRGWGPWTSLGGILVDSPAVTSSAPGRIDVVGPGVDGATWHRAFRDGSWGPWNSLGGLTSEAPAVTAWTSGRIDLFVTGIDRALWHRYGQDGTWSSWSSLGGSLGSGPAATSFDPRPVLFPGLYREALAVYVEGTDGARYWRSFPGGPGSGWSDWTRSDTFGRGRPAVVNLTSARYVIASRLVEGDVLEEVVSSSDQEPTWLP